MEEADSGGVVVGSLAAVRATEDARMSAHALAIARRDYEWQSARLIDRIASLEEQQMRVLFELREAHRQAGESWDRATKSLIDDLKRVEATQRRQPRRAEAIPA